MTPGRAVAADRSTVDGRGARRRLQALAARGWSRAELARRLGRCPSSLARTMTTPTVTVRTDRDVRALYQQLWAVPPPGLTAREASRASRIRAHAAARGWAPPLAWDDIDSDPQPSAVRDQSTATVQSIDDVAVERAVSTGDVPLTELTASEQIEAIHRLTGEGQSLRDIAKRLHTSARTVSRRRKLRQFVVPVGGSGRR